MTTTWIPRKTPESTKRLFMWATKGSALASNLYVSPDAARSAYREMARRRQAS